MKISKEQVLQALSHVEDPDLKKDLVTLQMIEDVVIDDLNISFTVVLTTPSCPMKDMIHNACVNAIKHFIHKDAQVEVKMSAKVTQQRNHNIPGVKNIILVSSGKGGVGKSTVSVNLAVALAQAGSKVGLVDADIYGPSVPLMMGLVGAKPAGRATEDGKSRIIPIEKHGIKVLSLGFFAHPDQPVPWRGPMASNAVRQMFNDADWGELDYLVVDLPPGTGDIHITLTQGFAVAGAVIVTTPQQVALADTRKGLSMFKMKGIEIPILGVVENMSYFSPPDLPENIYHIFGKDGGKLLAQQFDVPFLGELPLQMQIGEQADLGSPIVLDVTHPAAKAFEHLAQKVAQQVAIHNAEIH